LIPKRDTILKLFSFSSPGDSDFFFQNQPAFGVKDLFYYRYDCRFALLTHGGHLENLAADRNCFDFRLLANKGLVNKNFPRVRLLAHAQSPRFDGLLSNLKFLRK